MASNGTMLRFLLRDSAQLLRKRIEGCGEVLVVIFDLSDKMRLLPSRFQAWPVQQRPVLSPIGFPPAGCARFYQTLTGMTSNLVTAHRMDAGKQTSKETSNG